MVVPRGRSRLGACFRRVGKDVARLAVGLSRRLSGDVLVPVLLLAPLLLRLARHLCRVRRGARDANTVGGNRVLASREDTPAAIVLAGAASYFVEVGQF